MKRGVPDGEKAKGTRPKSSAAIPPTPAAAAAEPAKKNETKLSIPDINKTTNLMTKRIQEWNRMTTTQMKFTFAKTISSTPKVAATQTAAVAQTKSTEPKIELSIPIAAFAAGASSLKCTGDMPESGTDKHKMSKPKYERGERLLKDVAPKEMWAELDPNLNPGVDLESISAGSNKPLTWRCTKHTTCGEHVWKANPPKRLKSQGCRFCSSNASARKYCSCSIANETALLLYITHPTIFSEIDRRQHPDEVELKKITSNANRLLNFVCSKVPACPTCGCEHIWPGLSTQELAKPKVAVVALGVQLVVARKWYVYVNHWDPYQI